MNLFRLITRIDHRASGYETLTPRLLEDAGIERKEVRSIVSSMLATFTPPLFRGNDQGALGGAAIPTRRDPRVSQVRLNHLNAC